MSAVHLPDGSAGWGRVNRKFPFLSSSMLLAALALSSCWQDAASAQGHAVMPSSGVMVVYLREQKLYFPKAQVGLAHSYLPLASSLSVNEALLGALQSVADDTQWISRLERGQFLSKGKDKGKVDFAQYRSLVRNGSFDAIVVAMPVVELTPGLDSLMVVAKVTVQKITFAGPVELKHRDITETISLEHAGAPLSAKQLSEIRSGNRAAAVKARADIWFANHANRVRTGLLLDLAVLADNLRAFLVHPAEN